MANTYSRINIQVVFAVKYRRRQIVEEIREEVQKYMTGIIQKRGHKVLAIYCMPDHCHIFIGLSPSQSISDLVRDVKGKSSKWINEKNGNKTFRWQGGFGAFSYSNDQQKRVIDYILNQKEHHARKSFEKEYRRMLERAAIEYDEKYLFEELQ